MRRIAIINQKGGVGKTTSCCNIGAAIAAAGRRVLLIDLDPQAHLTMHLGVEPDGDRPSIYNVLTDNVPIAEAALEVRENLTLVPSHIDLAAAEMELVSVMGREVILRDAVARELARPDASPYEFLLIDCPPSLGVLTINGLAAVNEIIVPMQPHFLALQGVGKLLETIGLVRDRINRELKVSGLILCMYEAGTRLAGEVSADLASFLEQHRNSDVPWAEAQVYKTIIRRNIKLAECPSHGLTITEYAPSSNGAQDYTAITAEILKVETQALAAAIRQSRERQAAAAATDGKDVAAAKLVHANDASEDGAANAALPEAAEPEVAAAPARDVAAAVAAYDAAPAAAVEPFVAGDRLALGPDEIAIEVPDESSAAGRGPLAVEAPVAPVPKPMRRSIPVIYDEEPESAHSGADRG